MRPPRRSGGRRRAPRPGRCGCWLSPWLRDRSRWFERRCHKAAGGAAAALESVRGRFAQSFGWNTPTRHCRRREAGPDLPNNNNSDKKRLLQNGYSASAPTRPRHRRMMSRNTKPHPPRFVRRLMLLTLFRSAARAAPSGRPRRSRPRPPPPRRVSRGARPRRTNSGSSIFPRRVRRPYLVPSCSPPSSPQGSPFSFLTFNNADRCWSSTSSRRASRSASAAARRRRPTRRRSPPLSRRLWSSSRSAATPRPRRRSPATWRPFLRSRPSSRGRGLQIFFAARRRSRVSRRRRSAPRASSASARASSASTALLVLGADVVAVDLQRDVMDARVELPTARADERRRTAQSCRRRRPRPPSAPARPPPMARRRRRCSGAAAARTARRRRSLYDVARQGRRPLASRRGPAELEGHDVRVSLEPPVQRICSRVGSVALARSQHADQVGHRERRIEAVDGRER